MTAVAADLPLLWPCRICLVTLSHFHRAEPGDASDQLNRDGSREREADRALAHQVWSYLVSECLDDISGRRVERNVLLPTGEIQHRPTWQLVRGDFVRNHFLSFGHGLANRAPHALEYALHGIGLRGDVLVNGLEFGLGHSK
jgi:hypothetical protein